uniref:Uncharacterized protein n=1 Tax=Anguilla anguilla TaxID=7936 RepID=A0A0E9Q933_ANGAN
MRELAVCTKHVFALTAVHVF